MSDTVVITCAPPGVLTNPAQHPVPVTPNEMAAWDRETYDAGAAVMHVHFRQQAPGRGHLNASSDSTGAWSSMLFETPVHKIEATLTVMRETGTHPAELECFDLGLVGTAGMFQQVGMVKRAEILLVTGVASAMPCDADPLPLLHRYMPRDARWQATLNGPAEIRPAHRRAARAARAFAYRGRGHGLPARRHARLGQRCADGSTDDNSRTRGTNRCLARQSPHPVLVRTTCPH
jgi:uncharacterized protein (DUF849 family)